MQISPSPSLLRPHYQRFLGSREKGQRILLTGHSHQAWPDVAEEGVIAAFADAALHVDDKWSAVFEQAAQVRHAIVRTVGGEADEVALAQNTHELFTRFLSALPLRERPIVIASDGEFHSVYRQLSAAAQAGLVDVRWVDASNPSTLAERLSKQLTATHGRCAAVVTSSVLFQTGAIVQGIEELAATCLREGTRLFLDAYHSFQVVPLRLDDLGEGAQVTYLSGGGYKYAQWGEGACWMRVPKQDNLKPIFTGWFSAFAHLHEPRFDTSGNASSIKYGQTPSERFAGSTFDPTSLYRAAKVATFFDEHGLNISNLRAISLHQTGRLLEGLSDRLKPITPTDHQRGGFVAFYVEHAQEWVTRLRRVGLYTDARGTALRFGPAPYLSDDELDQAIELVCQLSEEMRS